MRRFDYVIGNPPYQAEKEVHSSTNGQNPRTNIFHYFQIEADKIADKSSVLIYPGGRWIHQFGKGLKTFGKEQINDPTLSTVEFYPDSKELFGQAADLSDGITIVVKNQSKSSSGFEYMYTDHGNTTRVHVNNPGDDLIPLNPNDLGILGKTEAFIKTKGLRTMHERILPRTLYGIESDFVENNPQEVRPYSPDEIIDFTKEAKVLTNDKAGKAGRAKWYITNIRNLKGKEKYLREWQVAVSSANAGGQKRDNQIEIIDNHSAFGRARVALASFKTEDEAKNFYKYCNAALIRYLFLMTDESLTSLGKKVIDIIDYDQTSIIDFDDDINAQLMDMVGLSESEKTYVNNTIKDIDAKRGKEQCHGRK